MVEFPLPDDDNYKWVVSFDNGKVTKYWKGPFWKDSTAWTEELDTAATFASFKDAETSWDLAFPDVSNTLPGIHTLRSSRKRAELNIHVPHDDHGEKPFMSRSRTGLAHSPFPAARTAQDRRRDRREQAAEVLNTKLTAHVDDRERRRMDLDEEEQLEMLGWQRYYEASGVVAENTDSGFAGLMRRAGNFLGRPKFSKERVHEIFAECFDGINPQPSASTPDGKNPQRSE